MRLVLAMLAGGISAGLTTVLWMYFGGQVAPTFVPAAAAAGSALLVWNLLSRRAGAAKAPAA